MSDKLRRTIESMPVNQPRMARPANVMPYSRMGRAMTRNDNAATLAAHNDYNRARVQMHRNALAEKVELDAVERRARIEQAEAQKRTALAANTVQNVKTIHQIVGNLSEGDPHLEMILRDMQHAFNVGEAARVMQRGMDL